jgi:transmembrane sensor
VSTERSEKIRDDAAHWLARQQAESWSERDQQRLEEWLHASTAHRVAFLRLRAAWKRAGRLNALGAGLPKGAIPSPSDWQQSPFFNNEAIERKPASSSHPLHAAADARRSRATWRARLLPIAAVLAMAAIGLTAWYFWPAGQVYETAIGGVATVPMRDGSKITLNTDSRVRIDFDDSARRVRLEKGEAYFDVAKDSARPFVVTAGAQRITAVGTAFAVRRDGADLRVTVTEGAVKLDPVAENASDAQQSQSLIRAGQTARATARNVLLQQEPLPRLEETLTWRSGYLTFHETTLADAVAEFNRYNSRRIVITDAHIAGILLTGKFESTQLDAFVRLVQDGFPITATTEGDTIRLAAR